jgi:hypothetical protein
VTVSEVVSEVVSEEWARTVSPARREAAWARPPSGKESLVWWSCHSRSPSASSEEWNGCVDEWMSG